MAMRAKRSVPMAAVALLVGLASLSGCGGDSGAGDDEAASADRAPGATVAEEDFASGDVDDGGGGDAADADLASGPVASSAAQLQGAAAGRSVISTASLEVRTADVAEASDEAAGVVEALGGFLSSGRSDLSGDTRAILTFKVPPEAFPRTLQALADLGELVSREVGTDDVTAEVVDLEGRLAAVTASVERLRSLLTEADDVPQVVAVEGELARREGELESLAGQLRSLEAQVDLATVTLTLDEPPRRPAEAEPSDDIPGFLAGLRTGGVVFVNGALALATAVGFLLPFLALAAIAYLPVRWASRRTRTRPASPAPAVSP